MRHSSTDHFSSRFCRLYILLLQPSSQVASFFWRPCCLPGRLQMQFFITITRCPVFPTCYICFFSSHTSHQFAMAIWPHYPRSYLFLNFFNSQFHPKKLKKNQILSLFYWCLCARYIISKYETCQFYTLYFILPQFNIRDFIFTPIQLPKFCGHALTDKFFYRMLVF